MQVQVRRPLLVIALLSTCVTLTFIGHTMPYPVLAPWLMERNIGLGALGWVSFAFSLGNLIGAPFAGNLVDQLGSAPHADYRPARNRDCECGYTLLRRSESIYRITFCPRIIQFRC